LIPRVSQIRRRDATASKFDCWQYRKASAKSRATPPVPKIPQLKADFVLLICAGFFVAAAAEDFRFGLTPSIPTAQSST
jgi:hypothetical protein